MAETKIRILFRTWQRLFPMVKTKSNVIFYKRNNFRTTTAKFVESIENRQKGERKDEANMLRKKTSRVIAFLMTMLLLTGGLTGCKGNPDPIDDPSSSGSNPGSFSASSDAAAPSGGDTTSPEQTPGSNAPGTSSTSSGRTNKPNGTTSNNGGNNTPGSNTVKGTVTLMIAADAEKETAAMLNVFKKKYPQVTLKTQVEGATNTIGQDLSKLSAAKKLPDVVLFGTENFAYIMSQGLAYPLDKLYAADPDKKYAFQAGIENYTYFNHLYALPFRLQFNTIGVNTDLFETLNLKDPGYNWTIAQFVDMAKKATTTTYSGINYIFDSGDPTHGLDIGLMNSLLPDGFGLYGYNMKNNTFNFTNGAWVKAKEVCKNLTNTPGLVADDLRKTSSGGKTAYEQKFGSGGDAMKAGKVLFTNTHSWQASWYDEVKHNWDFYPYPRKDDKTNQRIQTHVDFVCMTTAVTQANRDAAYALLKTLSYDKDAAIEYIKYCESQYASTKKRNLLTPASAHPDVIAYYSKSKVYPNGMKYMYKQVMADKSNVFVADVNKIVPNFWNNVTQYQTQVDEQIASGTAPASLAKTLETKVNAASAKTWANFEKKVKSATDKFYESHPYEK